MKSAFMNDKKLGNYFLRLALWAALEQVRILRFIPKKYILIGVYREKLFTAGLVSVRLNSTTINDWNLKMI
jgi:hypothetical protein